MLSACSACAGGILPEKIPLQYLKKFAAPATTPFAPAYCSFRVIRKMYYLEKDIDDQVVIECEKIAKYGIAENTLFYSL